MLRIIDGYCARPDRTDGVVLLADDTTTHGNSWYPPNINEAPAQLDSYTRLTAIVKRGNQ